ncbi:uncharacterized protein LOC117287912 [Asterias rubens]|nr:uncharacterized protein LOC117287912 [Asterias rubens]
MKEELKYQESKMQQYKKEVEKLRSQQSQRASSSTPGSDSIEERRPEATGGSGIIESCAIFAVKAENYKLTKSLEKTKKELEYKDLKYHDEVTKKTHAEQDARYWKEKARSLASHLKRAPQRSESVTSSPLKERNTNDVTVAKKSRLDDSTGTKYVEKIGGLKNSSSSESSTSSSSTSKSKRADYNWLGKAIAERDAEEKPEDDPQQCATQ